MLRSVHARFTPSIALYALIALVLACGGTKNRSETSSGPGSADGNGEDANDAGQRISDIGLATPESVLWYPEANVYLVSNIAGDPTTVDDDGFISRIRPDGSVETLRWIDGKTDEVELSAPKGSALAGGLLLVTDITYIRRFDRKTGAAAGSIEVGGAQFLNDLAVDWTGAAWVSDTATGKLHRIPDPTSDTVETVLEVPGINGVAIDEQGRVWAVAKDELFRVGDGQRVDVQTLPAGGLDGLVAISGGEFLVSSWDAKAVWRGRPGGHFREIIEGIESPADIGFDKGRQLVLIPVFLEDALVFLPLP